jgi:hypothetical protein
MRLGYAPGYDEKELEELEKAVVPLSRDMAGRIQDEFSLGGASQVVIDEIRPQYPKICKENNHFTFVIVCLVKLLSFKHLP